MCTQSIHGIGRERRRRRGAGLHHAIGKLAAFRARRLNTLPTPRLDSELTVFSMTDL